MVQKDDLKEVFHLPTGEDRNTVEVEDNVDRTLLVRTEETQRNVTTVEDYQANEKATGLPVLIPNQIVIPEA